jgi:hybrid polyketide synthase/nonribosomal peptide synthetase ACE1
MLWHSPHLFVSLTLSDRFPDSVDLKLMLAVGENLPAAVRGETEILEHMTRDHMLDNYYVSALGLPQCTRYIAKMASQVANRYPHLEILEIGAGTGGATKSILKQLNRLNQAFSSYTFTDISTGYFEKAQEFFKDYSGKMIFKVLDAEKDVVSQGYTEHSYDMVIASMVLHATTKLEDTMRNVRRLLKPGGYLLMLETTNNSPSRIGFTMGGLPGWWLGAGDGRALSPCISSAQWNTILRKTGFSGVDSITPELDVLPCPLSVIASQAVDDRVVTLRKPLQSPPVIPESQDLLILGGTTLSTSQLATDVAELLQGRYHRVIMVNSLECINLPDLPPMSTVLSLTDLDEPIFKSMTAEKLEGLKNLFDQSRNVLWVTTGCLGDDPYANMTVGFGRTLVLEMSHIRLQFLDIDPSISAKAQPLAEALLRLQITDQWESEGVNGGLLWTTEPELALDKRGIVLPRVYLSKARNDRYNSSKRAIAKESDPKKSNVGIICTGSSYLLQEWTMPKHAQASYGVNSVDIQVRHSLLSSIKIGTGAYLYLLLGSILNTSQPVLALSETQTSIVSTPQAWVTPCSVAEDQQEQFLLLVASNLLAQSILATIGSNDVILINEPGAALASAIAQRAIEKNVHLICTTESVGKSSPWLSIHPRTSTRLVKAMLPKHISVFMDMKADDHSAGIGPLILACLQPFCKVLKPSTIFGHSPFVLSDFPTDNFAKQLKDASSYARITISQEPSSVNTDALLLSSFPKPYSITNPLSIINWTKEVPIEVNLEPVDSKPMFSKDKTYLLFGLTGGLGQSLTQWMVQRGARYIVLTSRNPNINTRWLQDLESLGATVKIYQKYILSTIFST